MTAHYKAPGWFTRNVFNRAVSFLTRHGVSVLGSRVLAVKGRTSGEWRTVPVNVLELEGQRYLVAARGDTEWVRNLRVTGRGEVRRLTRVEAFRATELPDSEKPRIIAAYVARWGYQVKRYFEALPKPADHPVFRIERL